MYFLYHSMQSWISKSILCFPIQYLEYSTQHIVHCKFKNIRAWSDSRSPIIENWDHTFEDEYESSLYKKFVLDEV
jgi:hypothetical protein